MIIRHSKILYMNTTLQGIPDGGPGTAFKSGHIAKAEGRSIHHKPVPDLHTAFVIKIRQNNLFIRLIQDKLV